MRNKLTFVVIVSFLNTLLVTGAVTDFTFRSLNWYGNPSNGNPFNMFGMNTWLFATGMFLLTFIVIAVIAFALKEVGSKK